MIPHIGRKDGVPALSVRHPLGIVKPADVDRYRKTFEAYYLRVQYTRYKTAKASLGGPTVNKGGITYPTVQFIAEAVASHFNINVSDMQSKSQANRFCFPRQMFAYIARTYSWQSTSAIARFVNRDHTTIVHAYYKYRQLVVDGDTQTLADIHEIRRILASEYGEDPHYHGA